MAERHLASVGISAATKRHRAATTSPCVGSGGRPPRAGLRGPPSIRTGSSFGEQCGMPLTPIQLHTPLWACAPQRAARLARRGLLDPLHLAARASPSPRGLARHRVASHLLLPLVLSPRPPPSFHHSSLPPVVQQHPPQPSAPRRHPPTGIAPAHHPRFRLCRRSPPYLSFRRSPPHGASPPRSLPLSAAACPHLGIARRAVRGVSLSCRPRRRGCAAEGLCCFPLCSPHSPPLPPPPPPPHASPSPGPRDGVHHQRARAGPRCGR